jgi:YHS domain-containing protein
MGPLRILILAVLLYIGYRLIAGNFKKTDEDQEDDSKSAGKSGKITDVLVEDPICGKLVPKQQAHLLEDGEETHYFCSKECHDKFMSEKGDTE